MFSEVRNPPECNNTSDFYHDFIDVPCDYYQEVALLCHNSVIKCDKGFISSFIFINFIFYNSP